MTSAPTRGHRSVTLPSSNFSSSSNPPPPPPGHPNQPVNAFNYQNQHHPDYGYDYRDPSSVAQVHPMSQQPARSNGQGRQQQQQQPQEGWVDNTWRSIFDAALLKAQQAVQLDELGEATLAANLYAQAANDLGRVIPMCGSEKKKQSMLAIQAIYLDRVSQIKAAASGKSPSTKQSQVQETRYSYANGRGVAYGQEDQYVPQEYHLRNSYEQLHRQHPQYQPPLPQSQQAEGPDRGSKISGKKRSKTQPSAPQPPEFLQESYGNGHDGYVPYNAHGECNNSGSGGYISPPYTAPNSSPSPPPVLVSPIFMTHTPSPPPLISQTIEQQDPFSSSGKPFRWRPFGKKKSKTFSAGESAPSGPYQPPNDGDVPSAPSQPMDKQRPEFTQANIVDPSDREDLFSQQQQQHQDWSMDNGEGPSQMAEFEQHTQYYQEDEDVDPYYVADNKGRARAFEGKDAGNIKESPAIDPVEDKKASRKKPALTHNASSYSNDQPLSSTFAPGSYSQSQRDQAAGYHVQESGVDMPNDQGGPSNYAQDYGDSYEFGGQPELRSQEQYLPFDETTQWHHSPYSADPSVMNPGLAPELQQTDQRGAGETEQGLNDGDKPKPKNKWFGRKKKKDGQSESFDEVAKLMDEALFGGGSAVPRKKNKDKEKGKEKLQSSMEANYSAEDQSIPPNSLPMILPRKDSLTEYDLRQGYGARGSSLDVNPMERQRYYEEQQYQRQQQEHQYVATPMMMEPHPFVQETVEVYAPRPQMPQGQQPPKPLMPVTYAPKTAYVPQSRKQGPEEGTLTSIELPVPAALDMESLGSEDGKSLASESAKKSKNRPFNVFKIKRSGSKELLDQINSPLSPTANQVSFGDDVKSIHSDKTRKNSAATVESASLANSKDKKKRDSDEYIPYEYQEELEGPLMERVEVPADREILGFVLPVEEIVDYDLEGTDEVALDNWDSWVSQLESFEKVLSDKGLKKKNTKKVKKSKKEKKEEEKEKEKEKARQEWANSPTSTSASPFSSLKANRSSIFGGSTSRPSTSSTYDLGETRRMSLSDDLSSRYSFHSTRSSAIGQDMTAQQLYVQQGKKRWWSPKRKEVTSVYSVSEQDQERYLNTLLQNSHEIQLIHQQQHQQQLQQGKEQTETASSAYDQVREDAPSAPLEDNKTVKSLPLPQLESLMSSTSSTQEIVSVSSAAGSTPASILESSTEPKGEEPVAEEEPAAITTPKVVKAKSSKVKLQSISTPLATILQIQNPEELWLYVQQAKNYATTKMNKGDKRSAAIALKRAQALEARWQEIMLEMASSDEDEDELLDDDDDDDDEEEEEEEEEQKKIASKAKVAVVATSALAVKPKASVAKENGTPSPAPTPNPTPVVVSNAASTPEQDNGEEDTSEDDEQIRRRMHMRKVESRSDSAPDMYSKYKVNKSAAQASSSTPVTSTEEPNATVDASSNVQEDKEDTQGGDDKRLGPEATLDQMLATTNKAHLQFYIQRLKTDTVTKARSGNKFAALEGMKNVKVLQQRLAEMEEEEEDGSEADEE
ncbi:hypothetical protein BGZ58_003173 [Dissophora ornata]|nr:hypothetical protein BGZ58_003173 [Dissophora ornata]